MSGEEGGTPPIVQRQQQRQRSRATKYSVFQPLRDSESIVGEEAGDMLGHVVSHLSDGTLLAILALGHANNTGHIAYTIGMVL